MEAASTGSIPPEGINPATAMSEARLSNGGMRWGSTIPSARTGLGIMESRTAVQRQILMDFIILENTISQKNEKRDLL